jgi:hypothetical protein
MTASTGTDWELLPTTLEWVGPLTVDVDGDPVADFEVAVTPPGVEPVDSDFAAATTLGGQPGVMAGPRAPADPTVARAWDIYIRVVSDPETPEKFAGRILFKP